MSSPNWSVPRDAEHGAGGERFLSGVTVLEVASHGVDPCLHVALVDEQVRSHDAPLVASTARAA
jgi:hypothetical protein